MNAIFKVPNSGLIEIRPLPSGDITVRHTGSGEVFDIVNRICHSGRGHWKPEFQNWIIFERFAQEVLAEFEISAVRVY